MLKTARSSVRLLPCLAGCFLSSALHAQPNEMLKKNTWKLDYHSVSKIESLTDSNNDGTIDNSARLEYLYDEGGNIAYEEYGDFSGEFASLLGSSTASFEYALGYKSRELVAYDSIGNVTSANSIVTSYTKRGQLLSQEITNFNAEGEVAGQDNVYWEYDAKGRRASFVQEWLNPTGEKIREQRVQFSYGDGVQYRTDFFDPDGEGDSYDSRLYRQHTLKFDKKTNTAEHVMTVYFYFSGAIRRVQYSVGELMEHETELAWYEIRNNPFRAFVTEYDLFGDGTIDVVLERSTERDNRGRVISSIETTDNDPSDSDIDSVTTSTWYYD